MKYLVIIFCFSYSQLLSQNTLSLSPSIKYITPILPIEFSEESIGYYPFSYKRNSNIEFGLSLESKFGKFCYGLGIAYQEWNLKYSYSIYNSQFPDSIFDSVSEKLHYRFVGFNFNCGYSPIDQFIFTLGFQLNVPLATEFSGYFDADALYPYIGDVNGETKLFIVGKNENISPFPGGFSNSYISFNTTYLIGPHLAFSLGLRKNVLFKDTIYTLDIGGSNHEHLNSETQFNDIVITSDFLGFSFGIQYRFCLYSWD
jgi:hypothetical protein